MADYSSDPEVPQSLRRVARDYPDLFFTAAAEILEPGVESPAYRLLAIILTGLESFFECLINPARCPRERAVRLFRSLLAALPSLDIRLARMLTGRSDSTNGGALSGAQIVRALDILDQTSQGQRLMNAVGHLLEHPDRRVSAQAVLFVGHRVNDPAWTEKQLLSDDQRVRANAVEAVWGTTSQAVIGVLERCVGDSSNRVAGNALIGLHVAGRLKAREKALAMSESKEPALRSTAAWAMGKMGNQAFVERLTELMRDQNPKVRSTAIRSLVQIGRAESKRLNGDARQTGNPR
jgi:hypothetical protein